LRKGNYQAIGPASNWRTLARWLEGPISPFLALVLPFDGLCVVTLRRRRGTVRCGVTPRERVAYLVRNVRRPTFASSTEVPTPGRRA